MKRNLADQARDKVKESEEQHIQEQKDEREKQRSAGRELKRVMASKALKIFPEIIARIMEESGKRQREIKYLLDSDCSNPPREDTRLLAEILTGILEAEGFKVKQDIYRYQSAGSDDLPSHFELSLLISWSK